jgi:hypothetical protein
MGWRSEFNGEQDRKVSLALNFEASDRFWQEATAFGNNLGYEEWMRV